jgi:hypothetical protein
VTRWLVEHREQIRIFFLPSYSPELNPDELLNQDVKTNALGRVRPINVQEMMQRSCLSPDYAGEAHGGEELFLRTPSPIRRQLKSVTNLVLGVIFPSMTSRNFIGECAQVSNRVRTCKALLAGL